MCFSTKTNNGLSFIEHNEEIPSCTSATSVNVQQKLDENLMKTSDTFPLQAKEFNSVSSPSKEDSGLNALNTKKSSGIRDSHEHEHSNQSPLKTLTNEGVNNEKNSSFKKIKVYYYNNMIVGKNIFENEKDVIINQEQQLSSQPVIFQSAFFQPKTAMIPKKDLICYTDSNNQVHLRNNQSDEEYSMRSCTCSKTKCLKKYCECFANNQYCLNCNCKDCENNPTFKTNQLKESNETMTCTCTKSNCNKKYCECFKGGKCCNDQCRCINCVNKQNVYKGLTMERISVLIQNGEIYISITQINPDSNTNEKAVVCNQQTKTIDAFKKSGDAASNNQKKDIDLFMFNRNNKINLFNSNYLLNSKRFRTKEDQV